ncbi:MAG: glycoside hydrolase family 3 protein [Oscillospiraceae bacterium]|nr:glycoside hydrolase family 3 protein [Oscillospiraceae bacterium]
MKDLRRSILCVLLSAALLAGCTVRPQPAAPPVPAATPSPAPTLEPSQTDIEELMDNMTLEEKVGQLFIVRPEALDPGVPEGVTAMSETVGNMLVRCPVGGVVLFERNITDPAQLRALIAALQAASKTPLFIGADEEGGAVSRLAATGSLGLPRFPDAASIGQAGEESAGEMGRTIGGYMSDYGVNMDFAPVADVRTNPNNTVIGRRAFSDDPLTAARMAGAMAAGLRENGVIPVYKHFPGHGDTAEDSHLGLAVCTKTEQELRACEWLPYMANDLRGCAVMVGHIALPQITGDMLPASLSAAAVTGLLRGELGFDGLVVTDSLVMGGITNTWSSDEAALMALRAGCDMLLIPESLLQAYSAVVNAVRSGALPESRIDESVRRILTYKAAAGLL